MKNNLLIYGRFFIAILVFALCVAAFCNRFYPLKIFDWQFVPALQNGLISGFGVGLIILAALIGLTLLCGRIYCSTLCPLGIYQELLTILFKSFYKKRSARPAKHYVFAYFAAAVLFGTLCSGTSVLLRAAEPYSVFGNALSGAGFGIGFIIALTILVFFKKRFFCTNLCPVGAILGFISRFSLYKIRLNPQKCKMCELCARACPCGSIDLPNHTVNNETCIKCFKCLRSCRHGAVYYGLPQSPSVKFNPKRRQLITAGLVLATFGVAFRSGLELSKLLTRNFKKAILPAGAGSLDSFANRCLNCNLCVQNCPQKIIKPADTETPFIHLDYGANYCDYKCHKCSQVCPNGAIKRLTLLQKQNTKIAAAVINEDVCIRCGVCARECPRQIIIKEKGEFPLIQFDKCIGCGKCAGVCPVQAISIEPIDKQVDLI